MRRTPLALTSITLLMLATAAAAKPPRPELAGLRVGMSEAAAHASLAKRATKQGEKEKEGEREEQESWQLKSGPWGYVAFGVDQGRVSWVTAFARKSGRRIRYRDLGSVAEARRNGAYFLTWKVPAIGSARAYTVVARGTDSLYVMSVSLLGNRADALRDHPAEADSAR